MNKITKSQKTIYLSDLEWEAIDRLTEILGKDSSSYSKNDVISHLLSSTYFLSQLASIDPITQSFYFDFLKHVPASMMVFLTGVESMKEVKEMDYWKLTTIYPSIDKEAYEAARTNREEYKKMRIEKIKNQREQIELSFAIHEAQSLFQNNDIHLITYNRHLHEMYKKIGKAKSEKEVDEIVKELQTELSKLKENK